MIFKNRNNNLINEIRMFGINKRVIYRLRDNWH
jgi:hypothetical protein